jgi:SAM-dependent methyltransferase
VLFAGTDEFFRTTTREFDVVECPECGLIRLDPWPTEAELAAFYPPAYWYSDDQASGPAERYRRFVLSDHVGFLKRAFFESPDGPMVDVGSGGGLLLRLVREKGVAGVGFDFSAGAAAQALRVNGVPTICGDLRQSPLRAASCGLVTMFHVLEHLKDPAAYLTEAFRVLKPGGRLVVQVPNAASWGFVLFGPSWRGVDVPRHLINFRAQDLRQLIEFAGFEIVREKHFSLRDNPACIASSIAPSLDPMSRRVWGGESRLGQLCKDLVYFGLVVASVPFALLEAACQAGSTVMFDARRPG